MHLARMLGAQFTFISTCQGAPEYRYDDATLALRIAEELPADVQDSVRVEVAFHTPAQFRAIAGQFDLFIATRMHAAIQSLAVGTPVVPIAYEFKTWELARRLGIADYALDIDRMSGTSLISAVERLIEDLNDLRDPLADKVRSQRAAAGEGLELLANTLAAIRR